MTDLDQIAQRLEELSVDHDLPELAGLAEAMIRVEGKACGPECAINRSRLKEAVSHFERFVASMRMAGFNPPTGFDHGSLSDRGVAERMAMRYQVSIGPPGFDAVFKTTEA